MADTAIEWADVVWNPTTGCDKVSPGCGLPRWDGDEPHGQCYALTMAKRLKGMGQAKYQNDGDPHTSGPGFGLTVHEDALTIPLRWRKPRRVFVNSMSDLFHDRVPDEFIARVFAVMSLAPQHTFQLLTKRHGRMRSLLNRPDWRRMCEDAQARVNGEAHEAGAIPRYQAERTRDQWWSDFAKPLPNVWLGVSVEDQKRADLRIPALLATPAAVRWLSCEPLLGPVKLDPEWLAPPTISCWAPGYKPDVADAAALASMARAAQRTFASRAGQAPPAYLLNWVVVGGESGPGARPMHPDWARQLRDQCVAAGVPFFFKQWGEWLPYEEDAQPPFWLGQHNQLIDGHDLPAELPDGEPVDGWWAPDPELGGPIYRRVGKHAAGRLLDARTWDQYPAVSRG